MGMPTTRRHWTTADLRPLMDESRHWPRYELIDGGLLVAPGPGVLQQVAVSELLRLLAEYVEREDPGITLTSPAGVEFRPGTISQPAVIVVPARATPSPAGVLPGWTDVGA